MSGVGPAISVIVPVFNGAATIERTLAALAAQELDGGYEVIVVDGGSDDGTLELLRAAGESITVLHNPAKEPASSRNLGARAAGAPLLAFTDADCEPTPGWLSAGLAARAASRAEIVQGMVLPVAWHAPFDRTLCVTREHGLYETANLFVARAAFERVGGFEPLPGLILPEGRHFAEDTWFVWRAKRLGVATAFAEAALVHHAVVPRTIAAYLAEIDRVRYFPPLVALVPELRDTFLCRRLFFTARSLRFDAALLGVALALAPGPVSRVGRLRGLGWIAAVPYGRELAAEVARQPRSIWPRVAAGRAIGDARTLIALARGSIAARTPVL